MKIKDQKLHQLKWLEDIGIEYYCSNQPNHDSQAIINHFTNISKTLNKITAVPKIATEKNKKLNELEIIKHITSAKPLLKNIDTNTSVRQARDLADQSKSLEELKNHLLNFDGCDLKKFANNTVFAEGSLNPIVMLIGEAPGENEDLEGRPFCGESGVLLDSTLGVIGLSRSTNTYITNSVFWRPPANRNPSSIEIEICRPFLEKHIALIKPKLIILIGTISTKTLLGKDVGVNQVREQYYPYQNQYLDSPIATTAIFHPAYLLRQPSRKKETWYDLLKIQKFLNYS